MATPTQYSNSKYYAEFSLPTTEAKETDTNVALKLSESGFNTDIFSQMRDSAGADLVCTDASGNLVPLYKHSVSKSGQTMNLTVQIDPSTSAEQYLYLQVGMSGSYSSNAAVFTDDNYYNWMEADEASGDLDDSSGNYDGTAANLTYGSTGQVEDAVEFNGTTSNLYLTNPTEIQSAGNFTASSWLYWDALDTDNEYWFNIEASAADYIRCYKNGTTFRYDIYAGGNNRQSGFTLTNEFTAATWHHIVLRFDGSTTWQLYVDGSAVNNDVIDTGTIPATTGLSSQNLYWGSYHTGIAELDGRLDMMRLSSDTKSVNYILRQYNNENGFSTNSIWTIGDEGLFFSGTTAYVDYNNGSDSNDGDSTSSPFKTLAKAMSISVIDTVFATLGGATAETLTSAVTCSMNGGGVGLWNKVIGVNSSWVEDGTKYILDANSAATNGLSIGCDNIMFRNIEVKNATSHGFNITGGNYQVFVNCHSHNNGGTGFYGDAQADIMFYKCSSRNNSGSGYYGMGDHLWYILCDAINNSAHGIYDKGYCSIIGSVLHNNTNDGYYSSDDGGFAMHNVFDGNDDGISLNTSEMAMLLFNRITNNTTNGISVDANSKGYEQLNAILSNGTAISDSGNLISGGDSETTGVIGYTDRTNDNFNLIDAASVTLRREGVEVGGA